MLMLALAVSLSVNNSMADEYSLQKQLDAQQRTMLQIQNDMQKMNQEIASLRGEIEKLQYDLKNQAANNTNNAAQNTATSKTASTSTVTTTNSSNTTTTTTTSASSSTSTTKNDLPEATAEAKQEYNQAYAYITQNKLNEAAVAFNNYIQKYPNNSLTPNAWYWLGQVQYNQSKFDDARISFLNVARFSSSQKRPDSLYKLGVISKLKGDLDKANKYFNLVIQNYPNDTSASLAKKELNQS